jgi:uncharacterized membrane protein
MKKILGATIHEWKVFLVMFSFSNFISIFNNQYAAFFLFGGSGLIISNKLVIYLEKQRRKNVRRK